MTDSVHGHRGTAAIQALIERAPSTGALALWMQHRDVDVAGGGPPVSTDGRTVYYAHHFETLSLEQKMGWVAHSVLHVAFRHVARREALRQTLGDLDDTLYNVCADALVNSTLSHLDWLSLPAGAVTAERLLERATDDVVTPDAALLRYDVEGLYRAIDDRREGRRPSRRSQQSDESAQHGEGKRESQTRASRGDSTAPTRTDGPRSAAARSFARHGQLDLLPGDTDEKPEDAAENTRAWCDRLLRGHASDGAFSLLRAVSADLPTSRVPWPEVLRRYVGRALLPEPEVSWSRPSRSWIANQGRAPGGRRRPFEPGVVASRVAPRLVVVLDVSGSIEDGLVHRFFGHLGALVRRTRAVATVILGDDRVREVINMPAGRFRVPDDFQGGGGTDFEPLLAEAGRHRPDLAVVLTDLEGPAGPAPRFPVLWAVSGRPDHEPPFGRVLHLA